MQQRSEPAYPDAKSGSSFADGTEFQDFVVDALGQVGIVLQTYASRRYQFAKGESRTGAEIKLDDWCTRSQRLSIEVAEKSRVGAPDWTPSGIMREDNSWLYIQGNHEVIFIFAKNWLRRYYAEKKPSVEEKRGTIRTFYLPWADAELGAAKIIRPISVAA